MIVQEGRDWVLKTKDGKRVLGRHETRRQAEMQKRIIQEATNSKGK